jgi:hypothetical protein
LAVEFDFGRIVHGFSVVGDGKRREGRQQRIDRDDAWRDALGDSVE